MKLKKCANCSKDINVDNSSSFKICMHNQMHSYVCDSKCMIEFYGYKTSEYGNGKYAIKEKS